MRRIIHIIIVSTLCSFTHEASIGLRNIPNSPPLSKIFNSAVALEQNLHPYPVFDKVDGVLNTIDAVAKFVRDYNAIPKIGSCLKFIMPRFKTGREILKYYDHVKAKHEGRFLPPPQTTKAATIIYIYPSKAALGISKALSVMKMAPGEARVPQALKRVTCYNCRTRKEQWKRYNTFQNRRKRWPKQNYNPKHIIPASKELHLLDYVTVTVTKPITAITTRSFRDILPGPNQLPYYANMFLDVFDTHFETWNAKIRSVIHTIKQKWAKRNDEKKTGDESIESQSSYSSSESASESRSDSSFSSDYDSTGSESGSRSSYCSSEYYDESSRSDYSSRNTAESSYERRNERFYEQNAAQKRINRSKGRGYEYFSESSDEQERSSSKSIRKGKKNKYDNESAAMNQNPRQIKKKQVTKVPIIQLIKNQNRLNAGRNAKGTQISPTVNDIARRS